LAVPRMLVIIVTTQVVINEIIGITNRRHIRSAYLVNPKPIGRYKYSEFGVVSLLF
jgi:hypothetical protein